MTPDISSIILTQIRLQIPRWWTKWRPCKCMAVSQALIFHFKWYSLLHFAICQLLCWPFLLCLRVPETIFALNIFPYSFFMSSSTGNHIRPQYLPVPVFHFLPYGNPYPYLSFSSMGNGRHCNIPSRTRFSFLPVREIIFALKIFPYPFLTSFYHAYFTRVISLW